MPSAGGRYYRYKRYRYRRKPWKYRKRKWYRRNRIASSRSRLSVRIPVSTLITLTIPANVNFSRTAAFSPFVKSSKTTADTQGSEEAGLVCIGAVRSRLYEAYTGLFDEVKCDGMKVKMAIAGGVGAAAGYVLNIGTAVDRKTTLDELESERPDMTEMRDYAGYVERTYIDNSVAKCTRSLWASDLLDKTAFIDQNLQQDSSMADNTIYYEATTDTTTPPMFNPVIWLAVGVGNTTAAPRNVVMHVNCVFYMTFRSPKYGGGVNAKFQLPMSEDERRIIEDVNEEESSSSSSSKRGPDGEGFYEDDDDDDIAELEEVPPPAKKKTAIVVDVPKNETSSSQLSEKDRETLLRLLGQEASSTKST